MTLPPIGQRVRILPTDGVCAYLHGAEGVVVEHRFSRVDQNLHALVKLDEPRAPTPHWSPLTHIGLAAPELEATP